MASMQKRRPLAQRAPRRSGARFAGALLVAAASLASGCLVSFDGYQPLDAGGTGNVGATSGGDDVAGGKSSGGSKASGGKSSGGANTSGAGATEPLGGEGGDLIGGTGMGGNAGNAMGGKAGSGGATGGTAGSGGTTAGTSGTGGTFTQSGSGGGGNGGGGNQTCPVNLKGPPMIEIPKPGGGIYCMDRTEVTNADYKAFLDANVVTTGQGSECDWN